MLEFCLFVLACVGMTNIVVDSSLFAWLRDKFHQLLKFILDDDLGNEVYSKIEEPLTCHQCMGTWCGFFCGFVFLTNDFWQVLGCGFASSFLVILANQLLELILSKTNFQLPEDTNG